MISLITTGLTMIGGFIKSRQEIKARQQKRQDRIQEAATQAAEKRITEGNASAAELDALSIKSRGWKDEYLMILTTLPLFLAFVPEWALYVEAGFSALQNSVPEYYWYALAMIYIDTFGFRRMVRTAFEHWLQKRARG